MSFEAERRVYDYLERLNLLASGRVEGAERSRWVADVRRRIEVGRTEHGHDEVGTARAIEGLGDPVQLVQRELKPRVRTGGPAPAQPASRAALTQPGPPPVTAPVGAPPRPKRRPDTATIGTSPVVTDPFRTPETARTLLPTRAETRSALRRVRPLDAIAVAGLAVGGLAFPAWIVAAVLTVRSRALRALDKTGVLTLLLGGGVVGGALAYEDAVPAGIDGFADLGDIEVLELLSGTAAGLTPGGLLAAAFYCWRLVSRRRSRG